MEVSSGADDPAASMAASARPYPKGAGTSFKEDFKF
jgi:hypothetical protein